MTEVAGRLYTVEEFIKMPQYHERYELLDGKLVEKPMAKYEHGLIADIIRLKLQEFDPQQKLGKMLQEVTVFIRDDYSPTPDLSFWVAGRVPGRKAPIAPYPDLAIEIQSPDQSLKSLIEKTREYQKAGVKLSWIIQPDKKKALVFRQGQQNYETIQPDGELEGEEVIPGFELKLAALFEDEE